MNTKNIVFLGIMLAIVMVLSIVEQMLPPLPLLPPTVRIGLSNIVVMYCAFFVNFRSAVTLNILKAVFVFLTRGPIAGLLSLCGGMLSIAIIILLIVIFKNKISYSAVSVAGACFHNLGQFAAVYFLLALPHFLYYLPVLLLSGLGVGLLTGTLLKVTIPAFNRIPR